MKKYRTHFLKTQRRLQLVKGAKVYMKRVQPGPLTFSPTLLALPWVMPGLIAVPALTSTLYFRRYRSLNHVAA